MLGLSIGLIVNIPDLKKQNQKLKEYGTAAMSMVVTLFSAGVFTGVLKNTGILDNMATAIVGLIPTALGPIPTSSSHSSPFRSLCALARMHSTTAYCLS
mgnify:FL=1